jgi:hypothetical protein
MGQPLQCMQHHLSGAFATDFRLQSNCGMNGRGMQEARSLRQAACTFLTHLWYLVQPWRGSLGFHNHRRLCWVIPYLRQPCRCVQNSDPSVVWFRSFHPASPYQFFTPSSLVWHQGREHRTAYHGSQRAASAGRT